MAKRKPKALVYVYWDAGVWHRDCRRCHQTSWDQQWTDTLKDAFEHAQIHLRAGFGR